MKELAEEHLVHAAKDVSVAGMVGTAGMMLEYSGKGGLLNIDSIDSTRPNAVEIEDWLRMFVSLGFLVSVSPEKLPQLVQVVEKHSLTAAKIGEVDESMRVRLRLGDEIRVLFDFTAGPILTPKN